MGLEGLGEALEACRGIDMGVEDMARLSAEVEALAAVPIDSLVGEFPDAIKSGKEGGE